MFAKFIKKCALVALPASLLMTSINAFAEISQAEKSVIAKKFASVRPELVVSDIEKTDIDGMYLLNFSGKGSVYYVPKGDYFFTGDLLKISGSIDYCRTLVNEHLNSAIREISFIEENPAKKLVLELAHYVRSRYD